MKGRKIRNGPNRWMEGITFLSMERVIKNRDIGSDGIHMNRFGYQKFFHKISEYIQIMKEKREETRNEGERVQMENIRAQERIREMKNKWVREDPKVRKNKEDRDEGNKNDCQNKENEKNGVRKRTY